jgi:hypothetical protein
MTMWARRNALEEALDKLSWRSMGHRQARKDRIGLEGTVRDQRRAVADRARAAMRLVPRRKRRDGHTRVGGDHRRVCSSVA